MTLYLSVFRSVGADDIIWAMGNDCVFCKIVAGEIPAKNKYYEDEEMIAFDDILRDAPVHVLVVTKKHVINTAEAGAELSGRLMQVAEDLAKKLQITNGYQVFMNGGRYREVAHLHYHLKGGEK